MNSTPVRVAVPSRQHYRVVIVGGGPAACAAALTLQQHGVAPILIIESSDLSSRRVGESLRPDVRRSLQQLHIDPSFLDRHHVKVPANSSAWGAQDLGHTDFVCHPLGNGWHIDRLAFDQHLLTTASTRGIEVCLGCHYRRSDESSSNAGTRLHFRSVAGMQWVDADFVVDATGLPARLARHKGARRAVNDSMIVVHGYFRLPVNTGVNAQTLLEACGYGWWYRARLPQHQLIVALACDAAEFRSRQLRDWQAWLGHLSDTQHVSRDLKGVRFDPSSLRMTPAVTGLLWPQCGHNWLAVGDAACSVDPILGIGIHQSLQHGINSGRAIADVLAGNTNACHKLAEQSRQDFAHCLEQRRYLYSLERRWSASSFWAKRLAA